MTRATAVPTVNTRVTRARSDRGSSRVASSRALIEFSSAVSQPAAVVAGHISANDCGEPTVSASESGSLAKRRWRVPPPSLPRLAGMRLLVVEDNPGMAAMLVRGLRREGYAVDAVGNGKDALWSVIENDYDAVVLDA